MIDVTRLSEEFIANSLFRFVKPGQLTELLKHCEEIELQKGMFANRSLPKEKLYLLLEGSVSLILGQSDEIQNIIPGRSLELAAVLEKHSQWKFQWRCNSSCIFISIPWPICEKYFNQDSDGWLYLRRMSASVTLQKLKNDMLAMGVERNAISEFIVRLKLGTYRELLSDWTEPTFIAIVFEALKMRYFFDGKMIQVAHFKAADSAVLDLPNLQCEFEASSEASVWFLRKSDWNKLAHFQQIENFFDIYQSTNEQGVKALVGTERTVMMSGFSTKQAVHNASAENASRAQTVFAKNKVPLWWIQLKKIVQKNPIVDVALPSQSGFAVISTALRHLGSSISVEDLVLKYGLQESSRSLEKIKFYAEKEGLQCRITKVDQLAYLNRFPTIVPLIDQFVLVFKRHGSYFEISDFSSGDTRLISEINLDQLRSGLEVLEVISGRVSGLKSMNQVPWSLIVRELFKTPLACLAVILGGFSAFLLALILPLANQLSFDALIRGEEVAKIQIAQGAALLLSIFGTILSYLNAKVSNYISLNVSSRLLSSSLSALVRSNLETIRKIGPNQVVGRIYDTLQAADLMQGFILVPVNITKTILGLSVLWMIHPRFLVLTGCLGAVLVLIAVLLRFRMIRYNSGLAISSGLERQVALEHLNNSQEIQSLNAAVSVRWRWDNLISNRTLILQKLAKVNSIQDASSNLVNQAAQVLIFWFAASLYLRGDLTFGQIISGSMISVLVVNAIDDLMQMTGAVTQSQNILTRVSKLASQGHEAILKSGEVSSLRVKGEIEFRRLAFKYTSQSQAATLSNLNFKIPAGSKVCILGSSGSGKSTLAMLLNGLLVPDSGQILLDGKDIQGLSKPVLRKTIGLVEQEGALFSGSIQENISLFEEQPDMRRVVEAARVANIDEFALRMPDTYSYRLDYLGSGLSQGQKQRLLIARMAYSDPSLVILDEATSHLDPATEERVLSDLFDHFKGKTMLILTQRVNIARRADLVILMERGQVVAMGRHDQLILERGPYQRFFKKFLSVG